MQKKKILITGGNGMLAHDFIRTQQEKYEIVAVDRDECDITSFEKIVQCIALHEPDIVLNCAAYTAVDDAEDIGMKTCYEVNTLGTHNLARATAVFGVGYITISTDYVFDGKKSEGYLPEDSCNPIGVYGMSKYLGEKLALQENPRTIVVRTSWLYGGQPYGSQTGVFKNFPNSMLRIAETREELKVVSDQHGIPTSCIDLSFALSSIIEDVETYEGFILHLSNSCEEGSVTWANFAREIFTLKCIDVDVVNCSTDEYPLKAKRPEWGILKNTSNIILPDWKMGLIKYISR